MTPMVMDDGMKFVRWMPMTMMMSLFGMLTVQWSLQVHVSQQQVRCSN